LLCSACPERPLWGRDGLGAPDKVSGHAGQKRIWGTRLGRFFFVRRAPNLFGGRDWRCSKSVVTPKIVQQMPRICRLGMQQGFAILGRLCFQPTSSPNSLASLGYGGMDTTAFGHGAGATSRCSRSEASMYMVCSSPCQSWILVVSLPARFGCPCRWIGSGLRCWGKPLVSVAGHDVDNAVGAGLLHEGLIEVPSWTTTPPARRKTRFSL
jgi:hypothetical protein